jgi:hypothetical protein
VHVERGRIGDADPFKSSLATPEFHAALEVRVEIHRYYLTQRLRMEPASPRLIVTSGEDKGEAWEKGECNGRQHRNPKDAQEAYLASIPQLGIR